MTLKINNIVSFYRDCYYHDRNKKSLNNIFSKDIEYLQFIKEEEYLFTEFLPYISIEGDDAEKISKSLFLYRKEKELIYGSLFLVGQYRDEDDEFQRYCSPLLLRKAKISKKEEHFILTIDSSKTICNEGLLKAIIESDDDYYSATKEIANIGSGVINPSAVSQISMELKKYLPQFDSVEIARYPELCDRKSIKKLYDNLGPERGDECSILPASTLFLTKKMDSSRGVLDELKIMSNDDQFSAPLNDILTPKVSSIQTSVSHKNYSPSILSEAQENSQISSKINTNSMLIGPPGTGKSFTISSIVLEHITEGKSVLVSSKMEQALDVVGNMIENKLDIDNYVIRGGKGDYMKNLKSFLKDILAGILTEKSSGNAKSASLKQNLDSVILQIEKIEKILCKAALKEIRNGQRLDAPNGITDHVFKWMLFKLIKFQKPLWEKYKTYDSLLQKRVKLSEDYLKETNSQRLNKALNDYRKMLNDFLKAIRSRTGGKQEDFFEKVDFSILLKIFPVWLVNSKDIYRILPLKRELFDLAIIDEATQCDIASCLPILQRAKRVIISGDPKQLRHLSFLPIQRQNELILKYELSSLDKYDYRQKSILDFYLENITNQNSITFLNEHYRSHPSIINYSNHTYYHNKLYVMTEKSDSRSHNRVQLIHTKGSRDATGVNADEADKCLEKIKEIIENHSDARKPTIGILSPFRKQADHLLNLVNASFPLSQIESYGILVGTPYTFQGEERDIMILSLAIDDSSSGMTHRYLSKEGVFNVAITRAKSDQFIYYSFNHQNLKSESILTSYINSIRRYKVQGQEKVSSNDIFAQDVAEELNRMDILSEVSVTLSGYKFDLTASKDGKTIGIDLISYPGDFEETYSLSRYRMFQRIGFKIFPLPYKRWAMNKEKCLQTIDQFLNSQ